MEEEGRRVKEINRQKLSQAVLLTLKMKRLLHEPRNAGSPQKLERTRKPSLIDSPGENATLLTP